jgi:hypothetical protein
MNLKKIILPLLIFSIFLFLVIKRVNNIECKIENSPCTSELIKSLNTLKKSSFFFSNIPQKISEDQTDDSTYLLKSYTKKFPGTLSLVFKQENIKYTLQIEDKKYAIGKSGTIVPGKSKKTESILFSWKNDTKIIQNTIIKNNYHKIFLNIVNSLSETQIDKSTIIWISDSEILLEIPDQPLYIFEQETIVTQIKKVGTIINAKELEEIEEPILEIDMRFDLPVLRTRQ